MHCWCWLLTYCGCLRGGTRRVCSRGRSVPGARRVCSRGRSVPGARRVRSRGRSVPGARRVRSRGRSMPGARRVRSRGRSVPGAAQSPLQRPLRPRSSQSSLSSRSRQLSFVSAGPAQLSFVSAGPASSPSSPLVPPSSPSSPLVPPSSPSPWILSSLALSECPETQHLQNAPWRLRLQSAPSRVVEFHQELSWGSSLPLLTETRTHHGPWSPPWFHMVARGPRIFYGHLENSLPLSWDYMCSLCLLCLGFL